MSKLIRSKKKKMKGTTTKKKREEPKKRSARSVGCWLTVGDSRLELKPLQDGRGLGIPSKILQKILGPGIAEVPGREADKSHAVVAAPEIEKENRGNQQQQQKRKKERKKERKNLTKPNKKVKRPFHWLCSPSSICIRFIHFFVVHNSVHHLKSSSISILY